jgi:hypothetical protein
MYKRNFENRYNIGKLEEEKTLPILKEYFKRDIKQTLNKLDKYDFECDKYKYELKTRTNKFNDYPTTMIGKDKLETNAILIFKFSDDILAYIEYDEERFKTYETKLFTKYKIPKEHIYIPIKDLKIIS